MKSLSIPGPFVGKQGDLRGEREIGEARFAPFTFLFFGLFSLVFSSLFFLFFFFQKIYSYSRQLYLRVFSPMMDYLIWSGFKYNRTINEKTHAFSKICISKIVIYILFLSAFFYPNFFIRRYPVCVLQTPSRFSRFVGKICKVNLSNAKNLAWFVFQEFVFQA